MTDRTGAILHILGMALLVLTLSLPLPTTAAPHGSGFALDTALEPCSGQDSPGGSERCCFVCPSNLLALTERDSESRPLVTVTSLPVPERAQGIEPEPLRRPPRGRG